MTLYAFIFLFIVWLILIFIIVKFFKNGKIPEDILEEYDLPVLTEKRKQELLQEEHENMNSIKFEKVPYEEFRKAFVESEDDKPEEVIKSIYDNIKLPKRATKGSAGYDFHMPITVTLFPGETAKIPTGIRVHMPNNVALFLYPRSGLGFKYRLQLNNTVGIVDSDYYYSDNFGHIFAKITNDSNENMTLVLAENDAFMQGIFMDYFITDDDNTKGIRNGGFGSTDNK